MEDLEDLAIELEKLVILLYIHLFFINFLTKKYKNNNNLAIGGIGNITIYSFIFYQFFNKKI